MKDRYEFDAVIHELKDRGGAYVIFPGKGQRHV